MSDLQGNGLPGIRACFFDLDGLLINSEDVYMRVNDEVLHHFGSPSVPWSIRAKLQGLPYDAASKVFRSWVQLPAHCEHEFIAMTTSLQKRYFPTIKFMPGAVQLLEKLSTLYPSVQLGIASSSSRASFNLKTNHLTETLCIIDKENIILGDDPRILAGRGKPSPDIYLAALSTANDRLKAAGHETLIEPEECLVFEDSLSGLEAGRRAGMRVVWCPHPEFVKYAKSEEANPSNLPFTSQEIVNYIKHNTTDIDDCLDMDDRKWIISVSSLEDIDLAKLGVLGSSIA